MRARLTVLTVLLLVCSVDWLWALQSTLSIRWTRTGARGSLETSHDGALHASTAEREQHVGNTDQQQQRQQQDRTARGNVARAKQTRYIHPQVFKMFQRAKALMKSGDNVVAQRLLVRCLELNPYDSHSWLALAQLEAKLGNIERARDLFAQSTERCPNNVYILHAWGHLEQKYGNETAARSCWSQAVALDPHNAYVCHALSNLEKRLRNFDRAREILEVVVRRRPTAPICVSLAELERQEGNPERALEVLQSGLKHCTKEKSKLLLALAWLHEDAFDNVEEAEDILAEALRVDGRNVRVYVAKANTELRMGRVEEARRTLQAATQFKAEDGQHYTMWSTLELEAGHPQDAARILREGADKYPGDYFLLQRWGSLEHKLGNIAGARELYERSAMIQPHAPTFVAWAMLEEEVGVARLLPTASAPSSDGSGDGNRSAGGVVLATESSSWSVGLQHAMSQELEDVLSDLTYPLSGYGARPGVEADEKAPAVSTANSATASASASTLDDVEENTDSSENALGVGVDHFLALGGPLPPMPAPPSATAKDFARAQFKKARHLLSLGMVVDPGHGPLYHAYGNMELRHGNVTGARDVFKLGILGNCTDVTSLYHAWGVLELKAGGSKSGNGGSSNQESRDTAADIFRTGIELGLHGHREVDSGVGFLLHSLGSLEVENQRPEEAKRVFSTGVGLFPRNSHLLLGLALTSARLGEQAQAREHFKESVDCDPFHAHAWQSWALSEKQCGNIELARILFKQGLKKCPGHGALWQASAVMELQQGNIDVARTLFAQALSRSPGHAQSYQAWACLEVRTGNLVKAKALTMQGIRRAPHHAALWTVAGLIEDKLGAPDKARKLLETGIERFPAHGALYKELGELYERQGELQKARSVFTAGLEHDPRCAPVYHAAALLEARLGNLDALSEMHSKARESLPASEATFEADSDIIDRIRRLEEAAETGQLLPSPDTAPVAYVDEVY